MSRATERTVDRVDLAAAGHSRERSIDHRRERWLVSKVFICTRTWLATLRRAGAARSDDDVVVASGLAPRDGSDRHRNERGERQSDAHRDRREDRRRVAEHSRAADRGSQTETQRRMRRYEDSETATTLARRGVSARPHRDSVGARRSVQTPCNRQQIRFSVLARQCENERAIGGRHRACELVGFDNSCEHVDEPTL